MGGWCLNGKGQGVDTEGGRDERVVGRKGGGGGISVEKREEKGAMREEGRRAGSRWDQGVGMGIGGRWDRGRVRTEAVMGRDGGKGPVWALFPWENGEKSVGGGKQGRGGGCDRASAGGRQKGAGLGTVGIGLDARGSVQSGKRFGFRWKSGKRKNVSEHGIV